MNEAIALDIKKDNYIIFSRKLARDLVFLLEQPFNKVDDSYVPSSQLLPDKKMAAINTQIRSFRQAGILSDLQNPERYPLKINNFQQAKGLPNVEWRAPRQSNAPAGITLTFEAYLILIMVHILIKAAGFNTMIKMLKWKGARMNADMQNAFDFSPIISALNNAYFFFPHRIKCLEWACALTVMGLHRKRKCNVVIGVQKFPFLAHAWVEDNGKVIGDHQEFPQHLSIILAEPFGH